MKRLRLYLETSVWNFYFADDAPEKRTETIRLFEEIRNGKYEVYISALVYGYKEIELCTPEEVIDNER